MMEADIKVKQVMGEKLLAVSTPMKPGFIPDAGDLINLKKMVEDDLAKPVKEIKKGAVVGVADFGSGGDLQTYNVFDRYCGDDE